MKIKETDKQSKVKFVSDKPIENTTLADKKRKLNVYHIIIAILIAIILALSTALIAVLVSPDSTRTYILNEMLVYVANDEIDGYVEDEYFVLKQETESGKIYKSVVGSGAEFVIETDYTSQLLMIYESNEYFAYMLKANGTVEIYNGMHIFETGSESLKQFFIIEIKNDVLMGVIGLKNVGTINEAKSEVDQFKESGKSIIEFYGTNLTIND